ncbi:MAG: histidine kinase [Vicinamibacterales bacterium]
MGGLLNLIGLTTGIALYAMLLAMVVSTRGARTLGARLDPLLLSTAVLGLAWNLCALPLYELPRLGIFGPFPVVTAFGFSALGFLPAVVVHSVLRRDGQQVRDRGPRLLVGAAYGASLAAMLLHLSTFWRGDALPSEAGMRLLTYSFLALAVPLAIVTRGQERARRALWGAALAIFAVSALHLSQFHQGEPSWWVELLGHHASLPLAIAILYQDFPFAFADLFLKRALTLLVVVSTAFVALYYLGGGAGPAGEPLANARDVAVLVALWVGTALCYPRLRQLIAWFVDTIVLERPDYPSLQSAIVTAIQRVEDVPLLLDEVCTRLGPALSARTARWEAIEPGATPGRTIATPGRALMEVPVAEPPRYQIEVSQLTGGRRLLSDDHAFLAAVAAAVGRRIDGVRFTQVRYENELREQEMAKLATEAELRALRAQINPHFLFNALTTIGYLIQTAPDRAFDTLMRLTTLLRGVLRSDGEFTTLGRELDLIGSYLDIERARFEERLRVHVHVPESVRHLRVPTLLLQPIVENAVKHGIAPERRGGDVYLDARLEGALEAPQLVLTVRDSGAGATAKDFARGRTDGIGLRNIERRIAVQYGAAATLQVDSTPGAGTTVILRLPVEPADAREPAGTGARR